VPQLAYLLLENSDSDIQYQAFQTRTVKFSKSFILLSFCNFDAMLMKLTIIIIIIIIIT